MEFTKQNNQIIDIVFKEGAYKVLVACQKNKIQESEKYYFTVQGRYTNQSISLPDSQVEEGEKHVVFEVTLNPGEIVQNHEQEMIWDLYLNRIIDGNEVLKRVKGNDEPLRFLSILISDEEIFYPYTTRKGHLSFRKNNQQLFATLDSAELTEHSLEFAGYFIFPLQYLTDNCKILDMRLVVTNTQGLEQTFPLSMYKREEIANKYDDHGNEKLAYCGIKGEFPFLDYIHPEETTFFKLYLDCTYTLNDEETTIRSNRIRLDHAKINVRSKIFNYNDKKYKIVLKPTKKSKYLSLKIYPYRFVQEVKTSLRNRWVKIRRGRSLRKLYQIAFALVGKLPRSQNTIVFESFQGKQFSDNPRAIYEYLQENHYPYKMYWSADRRHTHIFVEKNIKYVRRFSIKWLFVMGRAKYWVVNARLPLWLPKPKNTIYLQTWHGTPLKRLGVDIEQVHMPGTNTEKYRKNFTYEASR